jgi:hypothetical protein
MHTGSRPTGTTDTGAARQQLLPFLGLLVAQVLVSLLVGWLVNVSGMGVAGCPVVTDPDRCNYSVENAVPMIMQFAIWGAAVASVIIATIYAVKRKRLLRIPLIATGAVIVVGIGCAIATGIAQSF